MDYIFLEKVNASFHFLFNSEGDVKNPPFYRFPSPIFVGSNCDYLPKLLSHVSKTASNS